MPDLPPKNRSFGLNVKNREPRWLRDRGRWLLQAGLIALAVWYVFAPVFHGGWVWDDHSEIIDNPVLRDPSALWKIWVAPATLDYFPLKTTVQWLQWRWWQEHTTGYHLTNVALHLAGALLLWHLLGKLGVRFGWLGGLLFAIHPLAVESVAWIAELKNTLSLPPLLLAMSFYLDYDEHRRPRDYVWSLLLFLTAMLCKTSVVMFPVMLWLHAWWKRGRLDRHTLKASAAYFGVSLVLGAVTLWFQHHRAMADWDIPVGGLFSRLSGAGWAIGFYFLKSVFPINLLPIYPRMTGDQFSSLGFIPWAVMVALLFWCWRERATWGRHVLLGLGWFLINLLPVIGLVKMSYLHITWVADHFAYLPLVGLVGLAAAGAGRAWEGMKHELRVVGVAVVAVLCAVGAFQSRRYASLFTSEETLWNYTLQRNPQAWLAHGNLAVIMLDKNKPAEALRHAEEAVRLKPDFGSAQLNVVVALIRMGKLDEALKAPERMTPTHAAAIEIHANLATALAQAGRFGEAVGHYEGILRLKPEDPKIHRDLAVAFFLAGRTLEALDQYAAALRLAPDAQTHSNFGVALAQAGRLSEAMREYREALRLEPANVDAHYNFGVALLHEHQLAEASMHFDEALRLRPGYAEAYFNLGNVALEAGRPAEAEEHFQRALQLKPEFPEARDRLALLRQATDSKK